MPDNRISTLPASSAALLAMELAVNNAAVSEKINLTQIRTLFGIGDIAAVTNSAVNSSYPVGAYAFNATATNGYIGDGRLTGARNGTLNVQLIHLWSNAATYARSWVEGSSTWSAWSLHLDAAGFTAKGQTYFSSASSVAGVLPLGTNGQVLTADSAQTLGVKWEVVATGTSSSPITVQTLSADAVSSLTSTVMVVMTTPSVRVGTYTFKYVIRYQSAATSTGVRFSVNHTGTLSTFTAISRYTSTGGEAATGAATQAGATATGNIHEAFSTRTKGGTFQTTLSVDAANSDMMTIIEGLMVVTAVGDLTLGHASELAALSTVMAGTSLILTKTG